MTPNTEARLLERANEIAERLLQPHLAQLRDVARRAALQAPIKLYGEPAARAVCDAIQDLEAQVARALHSNGAIEFDVRAAAEAAVTQQGCDLAYEAIEARAQEIANHFGIPVPEGHSWEYC